MGNGLQRQDRLAVDGPSSPVEQPFGMSEEKIGQLRLIGAAARLAIIVVIVSKPWCSASDDRILRQRHQPDRKLHGIALQAARQSVSVPALVELAEILADLVRKADPFRDPLGHLAVAGQDRNAHLQGLGKAALDRLASSVGGTSGETCA